MAAGALHSAALIDEGKLYTWLHNTDLPDAAGTGYTVSHDSSAHCRPKCVDALAGHRVVSVAAGWFCTFVVTDTGEHCTYPLAHSRGARVSPHPVCPETPKPAILAHAPQPKRSSSMRHHAVITAPRSALRPCLFFRV